MLYNINNNNDSSKILFSIPVHEEQDIIHNQIENILNNNPNSKIIIHVNKSFKNFIPEKTIYLYKNVYINSNSLNYIYGKGLLWIHINNFLEAIRLNINFKYFIIYSSNEMFIRDGLVHYIEKYKNGAQIVENNDSVIWHNFKKGIENSDSIIEMLKELKLKNIYGGQTEGQFYEKNIFQYISNIYIKYFGTKEISNFETEEIIPQTIFKSLDIEYGLPITLQNYSTNIIFNENIIKDIVNNNFKIEYIQIKENLISPHYNNNCSSVYSIKRIDRTFNPIRDYLSKKGFVLNNDTFQLNTDYYSNSSILKINTDNVISFKKFKSDKKNNYNWFGYEINDGYFYLNFHVKINKSINKLYIKNCGLKIHSPKEIVYNYFLENLVFNEWENIKIPIFSSSKQKIIFIFDEYLDDLDIEFKNIQFIEYKDDKKENIIISLYENIGDYNYSINYNNIINCIIEPLSKIYNVYTSISVFNDTKLSELCNYYKPFHIHIFNKTDNKLSLNYIFLKNMNDIINFVEQYNINIKFIMYYSLDSIFNMEISKVNFYVNKINFLSYHIPYINNIISNSIFFLSIPYKYLNEFIKILYNNINDIHILYLLYFNLKKNIDNIHFHFIYNDNYTYDKRTPLINYLSDIKDITSKGYIFENKYYYYINYVNQYSKMFLNNQNEYYFYKNKISNNTPYLWIGTYLNYFKDTKNQNITIKIEFLIKLLKKIFKNNSEFGLKTHEPISYYNDWVDDCITNEYTKIEITINILSKSQYIILNFDNYLSEVEFYIKDFKIIL